MNTRAFRTAVLFSLCFLSILVLIWLLADSDAIRAQELIDGLKARVSEGNTSPIRGLYSAQEITCQQDSYKLLEAVRALESVIDVQDMNTALRENSLAQFRGAYFPPDFSESYRESCRSVPVVPLDVPADVLIKLSLDPGPVNTAGLFKHHLSTCVENGDGEGFYETAKAFLSLYEAFFNYKEGLDMGFSGDPTWRTDILDLLAESIERDMLSKSQLKALGGYAVDKCRRNAVKNAILAECIPAPARAVRIKGLKSNAKLLASTKGPVKKMRFYIASDRIPYLGSRIENRMLVRYYESLSDIFNLSDQPFFFSALSVFYRGISTSITTQMDCRLTWMIRETGQMLTKQAAIEADFRLLYVAIALHQFQSDYGRYPVSLDEMMSVMPLQKDMLMDPFSGEYLKYRLNGAEPQLYSIGFDGVDDGGNDSEEVNTALWLAQRKFDNLIAQLNSQEFKRQKTQREGDRIWRRLGEAHPRPDYEGVRRESLSKAKNMGQ